MIDQDFYHKKRIAQWLKDRKEDSKDIDLAQMLLDYTKYLNACEEERQRA